MRTWLTNLWDGLRSGFWFLPAVMIAGSVLFAFVMLTIDGELDEKRALPDPLLSSAPAARTILSALAGALLTGTSVVFSVTMLVLAQTASQYGSRLLRTLADGNVAQATLGLFLGTSVFCLLALRSVREDGYGLFVPHLSVVVAVFLAMLCLCALVYFLNDVASSIQAPTVVNSVYGDLEESLTRLFPEEIGARHAGDVARGATEQPLPMPTEGVTRVVTGRVGYVQAIDDGKLMELARKHDLVLWIVARPGTFVTHTTEVVVASPVDRVDDDVRDAVTSSFLLGIRRTPRQDVVCGVNEVVEVGVRALSPGINDPFTAMTCIDYLGAALSRLVRRTFPPPNRLDDSGTLRIVAESVTFEEVLHAAFDMFARHAESTPTVTFRMLEVLEHVAERTVRGDDAAAIVHRLERFERTEMPDPADRKLLAQLAQRVRNRLPDADDRDDSRDG